ncbi:hypothetical protein V8G54_029366 [Vigna mungo]|uniref:Uncharacterized protein n=1 Tax=Vigna mungo TaxID=3915 RepID=A0AAQ3MUH5_VIGMU
MVYGEEMWKAEAIKVSSISLLEDESENVQPQAWRGCTPDGSDRVHESEGELMIQGLNFGGFIRGAEVVKHFVMPKLGVASGGFERGRFEFYNTPVTMCKELLLQGYVLPKFTQLTVTSYYAASSASHYGISLVTRHIEENYSSKTQHLKRL